MKKNYLTHSIVFLIILFSLQPLYSKSESRLSNGQLAEIYFDTLKKINSPAFDTTKLKTSDLKFRIHKDDNDPKKQLVGIRSYEAIDLMMDPYSGKIIDCYNYVAEENKTIHDGADKPAKDQNWALKETERYLVLLNGEVPKNSFLKDVKFSVDGWFDSKHSYDGEWSVCWGRKEGEYKFREDLIAVRINEKRGFHSYHYSFFSDYHPPKKVNIIKDQAIRFADKNVNKIVRSPFLRELYRDYKIDNLDSAELMIVNPNYAHKLKYNDYSDPKPYARLAWVVKYHVLANPSSGWADGFFEVWIDAETGEILGGG